MNIFITPLESVWGNNWKSEFVKLVGRKGCKLTSGEVSVETNTTEILKVIERHEKLINEITEAEIRDIVHNYSNLYEPVIDTIVEDITSFKKQFKKKISNLYAFLGIPFVLLIRRCLLYQQENFTSGEKIALEVHLRSKFNQLMRADSQQLSEEEYRRLIRCYYVYKWLVEHYDPMEGNQELFIFVAQMLEGPPDSLLRFYSSGGMKSISSERRRRQKLYEQLKALLK